MNASVQRVWVVGAGFLGRALATACRAAGVQVLTIDPIAAAEVSGSAAEAGCQRFIVGGSNENKDTVGETFFNKRSSLSINLKNQIFTHS